MHMRRHVAGTIHPAVHDLSSRDQTMVSRNNEAGQQSIPNPMQDAVTFPDHSNKQWANIAIKTSNSNPANVKSAAPHFGNKYPQSSHEKDPGDVDKHLSAKPKAIRSDTPWSDSETDKIPFTGGGPSPADVADNKTIVIKQPAKHETANDESEIDPQDISFIEGASSLCSFPSELYTQLRTSCWLQQTDYLNIIKTKWPASGISRTTNGSRTWFESPEIGAKLSAARYRCGKQGQLIVVKDDTGQQFNGGKPAIVAHDDSTTTNRQADGSSHLLHTWRVWNPLIDEVQQLPWCWKVIEAQPANSASSSSTINANIVPLPSQLKQNVARDSGRANSSPLARRVGPPILPGILQGDDALNAMSGLKRSSSAIDAGPAAKKTRLLSSGTGDIISRIDQPSGNVGARRDAVAGEVLLRRKSDGKIVMLRCPECDDNNCQTQQGLYNHLLKTHDIRLVDREAVADRCGILVDEAALKMNLIKPIGQARGAGASNVAPRRTQSQHRTTQNPTTPPVSIDPIEIESDEAHFVFLRSTEDENPRRRSLDSVNSAEKLFVNALVAGVARRNTLMLTVAIANSPLFHVVKNDKQDFALIMERIPSSEQQNPDVVVTVEDSDD